MKNKWAKAVEVKDDHIISFLDLVDQMLKRIIERLTEQGLVSPMVITLTSSNREFQFIITDCEGGDYLVNPLFVVLDGELPFNWKVRDSRGNTNNGELELLFCISGLYDEEDNKQLHGEQGLKLSLGTHEDDTSEIDEKHEFIRRYGLDIEEIKD